MNFNNETRVNEVALSDPTARRILEDAGVDYCCGGAKPLGEACLQANVGAEDILRSIRENAGRINPEQSAWLQAPLSELTQHIREKHHKYVRDVIPRLRGLLAKLHEKYASQHPEVGEIQRQFEDVSHEMLMPMQEEEQILFPYIEALERAANKNAVVEPPLFQTVRNPIHLMMQEHDAAGELVRQIRKASHAYQAPSDACTTLKATYQELRHFEEDLHLHVKLENNILFPRAVELEASAV